MDWLREIREKAEKSQLEIADAVHISQPAYSNIEHGERQPSVKTAKKIAEALGFDWTRFFEDRAG